MMSVVSINQKEPHWRVVRCQVIILIQVFSNLMEVKGIKYTCKVASRVVISDKIKREDEQ